MKIFFFCFPIQRLPFSVGFIGCMVGTIYVSMVLHSYFLSVIFSVLQVCPSPMQCLTWLYLFKLCYTAENTCFSAFRVFFSNHGTFRTCCLSEQWINAFLIQRGLPFVLLFSYIFFLPSLPSNLRTIQCYDLLLPLWSAKVQYLLILLHIPLFGLTQFSLFDPGSSPCVLYHILLPRRI